MKKSIIEISVGIIIAVGIVALFAWGQKRELCLVENPAHAECKDFSK